MNEFLKKKVQTIGITGAGGFLGSALARRLVDEVKNLKIFDPPLDVQIVLIDSGYRDCRNIQDLLMNTFVHFEKVDITNFDRVKALFEKYNINFLFHAAALVGEPICKQYPTLAYAVNVEGTLNIVKNYQNDLLLFSTGSVYGSVTNGLCEEDTTPTKPLSIYGQNKLEAERVAKLFNPNTIIYRFSTACGVSSNPRLNLLPNDFVWQAIHHKALVIAQADFARSFVSVNDIVSALLFALYNTEKFKAIDLYRRIFNIGHEANNITKRELAQLIQKYIDFSIFYDDKIYADGDMRNYKVSFDKIKALGWSAKDDMDTIVQQLIKGVKLIDTKPKFD